MTDIPSVFDLLVDADFAGVVQRLRSQYTEEDALCLPYIVLTAQAHDLLRSLTSQPRATQYLARISAYNDIDATPLTSLIASEQHQRKTHSHLDKKSTVIDTTAQVPNTFESGDYITKLRLVLSDLVGLLDYAERHQEVASIKKQSSSSDLHELTLLNQTRYESEILDVPIYLAELSCILPLVSFKFSSVIDLQALVISLLFMTQAPLLIRVIVVANPLDAHDIVEWSLDAIELVGAERIRRVLIELCKLSLNMATHIREQLISRETLPDAIFAITSHYVKDDIEFLSNIIVNRTDYLWIKDYLAQRESPAFHDLRDHLLARLERAATDDSPASAIVTKAIVRLYCGLSGLLGIKLNLAEITTTLALIDRPSPTRTFPKIFLCFLLVCEGLVRTVPPKRITESLNNLRETGICDDLLLLVSIYFHTRQLQNIVAVVRSILGFRPSIHTESLTQIGELLTKDIFPEALVALKASLLPIAANLTTHDANISITCIYHLLSERIFEKYETDMGPWIWSQTLSSSTPIHYLLPSCLDKLVKNIIEPSIVGSSPSFYMKRVSETDIMAAFKKSVCPAVQVLVIYYVMRYNDSVMKLKTEQSARGKQPSLLIENTQLREYSIEFMSKLPIQRCISIISSQQSDYFFVIPPFLYLISSQFPQFFNVGLLLIEEERIQNPIESISLIPQYFQDTVLTRTNNAPLTVETLASIVKKTDSHPTSTDLILKHLNTLPDSQVRTFITPLIDHLLPILIQSRAVPSIEGLISPFVELWSKMFPIDQSEISLRTINVLTAIYPPAGADPPAYQRPSSHYTHMDAITDPLLVFRSHAAVFTCPPLFKMLLQILFFYMMSSKKHLQNQIQMSSVGSGRQEEITTLILTQESSIIQMLLELCVVDRMVGRRVLVDDDQETEGAARSTYDPVDIEEIRCNICSFIHQLFIEKPLLAKLVHFQGYMCQVLPITVTHIPSMHICFDFLPELLSQPHIEKQVFSIQLVAFLAERYPIARSLRICRQAIGRIAHTLHASAPIDRDRFLVQVLPSITRITKTYPTLAEDCLQILIEQLPSTQITIPPVPPSSSSSGGGSTTNTPMAIDPTTSTTSNNVTNNNQNIINSLMNNNNANSNNNNHHSLIESKILQCGWHSVKDKPSIQQDIHQAIQTIIKNVTNH
eukprot:gene6621-7696_t